LEAARQAVLLLEEWLSEPWKKRRIDPHPAIANTKQQLSGGIAGYFDPHRSGMSEFDRIGDQVHQRVGQAVTIEPNRDVRFADLVREYEALLVCQGVEVRDLPLDQRSESDRRGARLEGT